jgi:cytochrome c biogenesis factor
LACRASADALSGYVGFSILLCLVVAALLEGRIDAAWALGAAMTLVAGYS